MLQEILISPMHLYSTSMQEEGLQGFHCADWLDFMQNLESKFRTIVLRAMKLFS